jgi:NAD(P)H-dependent flavin oxidoreductase YrpB (nitropropane dioxygenase family)
MLLRRHGEGNADAGVLASGHVVGALTDLPTCADLITRIGAEAEDVVARLPR